MNIQGSDKIGQLRDSFNHMISTLREKEVLETEIIQLLTHLAQKNKELETIVYAASHDLRAPFINIVGFSERLRKNCDTVTTIMAGIDLYIDIKEEIIPIFQEKISKSIDFIRTSAKKMENLVAGLLQLSHIGRTILKPEEINMNALI